MHILFANGELRSQALSLDLLVRTYGKTKGRRMGQRLAELHTASNLEVVRSLPTLRCLEVANRFGHFTICTLPPAVMLFTAEDEDCFDGKAVIWHLVTAVKVISLDEINHE